MNQIPERHEIPEADLISHEVGSSCVCAPKPVLLTVGGLPYALQYWHSALDGRGQLIRKEPRLGQ